MPRLFSSRAVATLAVAFALLGAVACAPGEEAPPAVSFTTEDGVTLVGHLFGSGDTGVVLAHMYPADQRSWFGFARELAQAGYRALTFDFRGYGESGGDRQIDRIDRDMAAAAAFLRGQGVNRLFLIGASMGGTAAIIEAAASPQVAGVITLSAPVEFQGLSAREAITTLSPPALFLASQGDRAAAQAARWLYDRAAGPRDIRIVAGAAHGTEMLKAQQGPQVKQAILAFLRQLR